MKTFLTGAAAALALAASCGAIAQSASAPAKVAVSASDAAMAEKKAVPKAEVGTVVRTGPTATDKAKSMADDKTSPGARPKKASAPMGSASRAMPAKAD